MKHLRPYSILFVLLTFHQVIISESLVNTNESCTEVTDRQTTIASRSAFHSSNKFLLVDFATNFILADIIRSLDFGENSLPCYAELKILKFAIDNHNLWAIKGISELQLLACSSVIYNDDNTLESSAVLPNNFIYGNNLWLGSRFECESISDPKEVTVVKHFYKKVNQIFKQAPPFSMNYKIIHATIYSPMQVNVRFFSNEILHLGLCLPQSCKEEVLLNLSKAYFSSDDSIIKVLYNITSENIGAKDLVLSQKFYQKQSLILLGIILISTLTLAILAEIFSSRVEPDITAKAYISLLRAFSLRENFNAIFRSTEGTLLEINGLRWISNCYILAFHVQYFTLYKLSSKWMGLVYTEDYKFQVFNRGPLFVDAFFAVSGFLLTNSYLKNENQTIRLSCNSFWLNLRFLILMTLKRLIRIVPLYAVIILVTEITTCYLRETSAISIHENDDYNCQNTYTNSIEITFISVVILHRNRNELKNVILNALLSFKQHHFFLSVIFWWRNLLFIQNLFPHKELCLNWSWTLACEMQYFLICSFIYIAYCKRAMMGKCILAVSLIVILGTSVYLLIKNQFVPTVDVLLTTLDDIYISPFSRSPPYFIGAGIAYFVVKRKFQITKLCGNIFWSIAIAFLGFTLAVPIKPDLPVWLSVFGFVAGKWILSLCFCWFFLSDFLGHKNFFTKCLSHPSLNHFGKISFAFYMLNPLLLIFIFGTSDYAADIDPLVQMVFVVGITVITYVLSIGFTITFEMPYQKLFKSFTK